MPVIESNGVALQVSRYGPSEGTDPSPDERPLVVFVHGLMLVDQSSFTFTLGLPLAATADVLLYDLRGHGRSAMPPEGYTVDGHVADLEALVATLGLDRPERPFHLVAMSFGGAIALTFAGRHPDLVRSLVLVDAHYPYPGFGALMAQTIELTSAAFAEGDVPMDQMKAALHVRSDRKALQIAKRAQALASTTSIADDLRAAPDFTDDDYAAVTCPVLGIYGGESDVVDAGRRLATLLPDMRLEVVEGAGHFVILERAETTRELVAGWIDEHQPSHRT